MLGFPGDRGQEHAESGAAIGIALRPDAAAVLHDDGAADGQAQPGSALLPASEASTCWKRSKIDSSLSLGNAAAVIFDADGDPVQQPFDRNRDLRLQGRT
jgi:hypothetical protein